MSERWAFTIKYNPNNLTESEYKTKLEQLMNHWKKNGVNILEYKYEDQTKKALQTKIHIHGTCDIRRGIYRKKLMLPNYHIKLVEWRDMGWNKYITKNIKVKMVNNNIEKENVNSHILEPSQSAITESALQDMAQITEKDIENKFVNIKRLFK